MDNLILWILFMLLDLTLVLISFRLFGKMGLYVTIAMSIIIANIQVIKIIEIAGITLTLGNIIYGSIFLATDILSEVYGKKEAQKGVWIGFFVMIVSTLYMQIALMFNPSPEDFIQPHMVEIFSFLPRIVFASMTAYLISQMHDVWAFNFWKKKFSGKYLWFRNNASTWISQLIDSCIFSVIAFWGVFPMNIFWQILITTYVFKIIVAAVDTPFIYLAKYIKKD